MTHGEIAAHLAEVYGAEVWKQTITTITDRVMEGMTEWQSRPLDPGRCKRCPPVTNSRPSNSRSKLRVRSGLFGSGWV